MEKAGYRTSTNGTAIGSLFRKQDQIIDWLTAHDEATDIDCWRCGATIDIAEPAIGKSGETFVELVERNVGVAKADLWSDINKLKQWVLAHDEREARLRELIKESMLSHQGECHREDYPLVETLDWQDKLQAQMTEQEEQEKFDLLEADHLKPVDTSVLPHNSIEGDCCGCLYTDENGMFTCNECGDVFTIKLDSAMIAARKDKPTIEQELEAGLVKFNSNSNRRGGNCTRIYLPAEKYEEFEKRCVMPESIDDGCDYWPNTDSCTFHDIPVISTNESEIHYCTD